ncbi:MAG: maleylpyruvate isomerase family mycothiol-dependent enzyme [Candidatus Dormibacteraceae bacterium]
MPELPLDQRERLELCSLLLELGPDAPTLCEGWTTFDLAAHLTLREHFRRWGPARMQSTKALGFPAIVARLQRGAPLVPWRIPRLRTFLNGTEYFIHHEDVRRANGQSRRTDRPDLDQLAWRTTGLLGRGSARAIRPFGLELRTPDGRCRRFGSSPAAVVTGQPTELLLYASGRRTVAEVQVSGDADAVAALKKGSGRL